MKNNKFLLFYIGYVIIFITVLVILLMFTLPYLKYQKYDATVESGSYIREEKIGNSTVYFQRLQLTYKDNNERKAQELDWTNVDSPIGYHSGDKVTLYVNPDNKKEVTLEIPNMHAIIIFVTISFLVLIISTILLILSYVKKKKI